MTRTIHAVPTRLSGEPLSLPARGLHRAVRGYRWLMAGRQSPCRYYPSCSTYALEALEVHGAVRGSWLTARRLGRCHPWGGHGIDLVPQAPDDASVPHQSSAAAPVADRKAL